MSVLRPWYLKPWSRATTVMVIDVHEARAQSWAWTGVQPRERPLRSGGSPISKPSGSSNMMEGWPSKHPSTRICSNDVVLTSEMPM